MAYRFDDFKWLGNMAGFGVPTDVYYGTVYLGLIESKPDGYVIQMVDTPKGKQRIKQGGQNLFKTKEHAAEILHKTWKILRGGQIQDKEGEEWKLSETVSPEILMSKSAVYRKEYKKLVDIRDAGIRKIDKEYHDEVVKSKPTKLTIGDWSSNPVFVKFAEKKNQILVWFAEAVEVLNKTFEDKFEKEPESTEPNPYGSLQKSDDTTGKDLDIQYPPHPFAKSQRTPKQPKNKWDGFLKALKSKVKLKKITPQKARKVIQARWKRLKKMFKESSE